MLNILQYLEQDNKKQALIFLDLEKTFDNLNWIFLFKVLEDMNFEDHFIKWVKSIDTSQKKTNNS